MLDIIFIILLIIGAYAGFKRGFILEIIGIFALFIGLYGAFKLLNWGIGIVVRILPEYSNVIPFILFIIIFIVIILLVNLLGRMLKKFIDMTILGSFDKIAGAIMGFFTWAFLISLILWLLNQANINLPQKRTQDSYIYPYIVSFAPTIGGYFSSLFPFAETMIKEIKDLFIK